MSIYDNLVLAAIIGLLLFLGLSAKSQSGSTEDFFLAGRKLRWWQIGFSLFATNFSAGAIIGLTGAAYITGIAIYNYEWVGVVAMVFFALILVGAVRRSKVYTIAQFLEERYDKRIKVAYSAFVIFLIIFIDMASSLYVGGLLLREVFPSVSLNVIIFIIMILTGTYSIMGGLSAISRTDMLQSLILITGAVLVSYFTLKAAGGWHQVVANAPDKTLSLIRPIDDRAVPWTGLIIGVPILCAYFWLVNQNMVQWVLSARSEQDARRGLLLAGYMKLLVLFIIIIPGVAAIGVFPELTEPDRIYPTLLFELLPAGVLGLVLAGFVAAIMSNADSTLHAASTIITMDFVKKSRPDFDAKKLVNVGRLTSMIVIFLSALWAPMIGNFGTLFEYVQGLLSYAVAPFAVVYVVGWFWPKANASGAIAGLSAGLLSAAVVAVMQFTEVIHIHYLHVPLPVTVMTLIVLIGVSLQTPTSVPSLHIVSKSGIKVSRVDIVMSIILMFLVALQIWLFW